MSEGVVPEGWRIATIADVAKSSGGGTPPKSDSSYWSDGTVPWVSPKDMKTFLITASEDSVTSKALSRLSLIPSDSVLVVVRSGILSRTFPVSINKLPVTVNQDMRAFLPESGINARYIAWQFISNERDILDCCAKDGTTVASIEGPALAAYPLAIAPRAEQTRIVEKLEELLSELDAGVAELKAAQRKLAQYRQSLLKAAVEGALTADWRAARQTNDECPSPPSPRRRESMNVESKTAKSDEQKQDAPSRETGGDLLQCGPEPPSPSSPSRRGSMDVKSDTAKSMGSRLRGNDERKQGTSFHETGADLLQRILTQRRASWETKQLAKFSAQGKTPPHGWQAKYPEPAAPDTNDLPALPEGWVWASVDQLSFVVRGASPRPAGDPRYFGGLIPWITVGSLTADSDMYLDQVDHFVTEAGRDASRYIEPNTLLLTNSGATLGVPKITRIGGCINDGSVALLNVDEPTKTFLYWFLRTQTKKLRALNQGAAQPNLNTDIVRRIIVPVCDHIEMAEINAILDQQVSSLRKQEEAISRSLQQAAAQRKNLLKAAFAGQLVPQDPDDEPASVLLERIRAERAAGDANITRRGRKARDTA